jgi:uncharacterized LabA/DUF88 family protein
MMKIENDKIQQTDIQFHRYKCYTSVKDINKSTSKMYKIQHYEKIFKKHDQFFNKLRSNI